MCHRLVGCLCGHPQPLEIWYGRIRYVWQVDILYGGLQLLHLQMSSGIPGEYSSDSQAAYQCLRQLSWCQLLIGVAACRWQLSGSWH